jgi:hypothetical protein
VSNPISPDDLMRYVDGELSPEERAHVDSELRTSTELQREVAILRALKSDFRELSFRSDTHGTSVWDQVNAHVNRPIGWVLVVAGLIAWTTYGAYVFATSATSAWEKLATGAVVIGVILLLASVIWERYREWDTDPYRDVQR